MSERTDETIRRARAVLPAPVVDALGDILHASEGLVVVEGAVRGTIALDAALERLATAAGRPVA